MGEGHPPERVLRHYEQLLGRLVRIHDAASNGRTDEVRHLLAARSDSPTSPNWSFVRSGLIVSVATLALCLTTLNLIEFTYPPTMVALSLALACMLGGFVTGVRIFNHFFARPRSLASPPTERIEMRDWDQIISLLVGSVPSAKASDREGARRRLRSLFMSHPGLERLSKDGLMTLDEAEQLYIYFRARRNRSRSFAAPCLEYMKLLEWYLRECIFIPVLQHWRGAGHKDDGLPAVKRSRSTLSLGRMLFAMHLLFRRPDDYQRFRHIFRAWIRSHCEKPEYFLEPSGVVERIGEREVQRFRNDAAHGSIVSFDLVEECRVFALERLVELLMSGPPVSE